MGEETGVFIGFEIEHSQFYGLKTIFFSRFSALVKRRDMALLMDDTVPMFDHVFIALVNPGFFEQTEVTCHDFWHTILAMVDDFIAAGKVVTFELDTALARMPFVTVLRERYPTKFCAMITVEVPLLDVGGYCIKLAPTNVFTHNQNETCVKVLPAADFDAGTTRWIEYEADRQVWKEQ